MGGGGGGGKILDDSKRIYNKIMENEMKVINRIEQYNDGVDSVIKVISSTDGATSEEELGPPLPPRPPPRPRNTLSLATGKIL